MAVPQFFRGVRDTDLQPSRGRPAVVDRMGDPDTFYVWTLLRTDEVSYDAIRMADYYAPEGWQPGAEISNRLLQEYVVPGTKIHVVQLYGHLGRWVSTVTVDFGPHAGKGYFQIRDELVQKGGGTVERPTGAMPAYSHAQDGEHAMVLAVYEDAR